MGQRNRAFRSELGSVDRRGGVTERWLSLLGRQRTPRQREQTMERQASAELEGEAAEQPGSAMGQVLGDF